MISTSLAFLGDIGAPEAVLVLFAVLILFGGQKLPELARGLGKSIREFKRASAGVEQEIKRAIESVPERPSATPPRLAADSPATPPIPLQKAETPADIPEAPRPPFDTTYEAKP